VGSGGYQIAAQSGVIEVAGYGSGWGNHVKIIWQWLKNTFMRTWFQVV